MKMRWVNKRQRNQQRRIGHGIKSSQLTPGDAARLEAREAKIQGDKQKAKADRTVTPAERRKLQREEEPRKQENPSSEAHQQDAKAIILFFTPSSGRPLEKQHTDPAR